MSHILTDFRGIFFSKRLLILVDEPLSCHQDTWLRLFRLPNPLSFYLPIVIRLSATIYITMMCGNKGSKGFSAVYRFFCTLLLFVEEVMEAIPRYFYFYHQSRTLPPSCPCQTYLHHKQVLLPLAH